MTMKRHLPLILPAAVGFVLIAVASLVQGLWTERWAPTISDKLKAYAAALESVPTAIGAHWEAKSTTEMDPREREAAGAVGDLSRTYWNPRTQEEVSVYLICGPSRHVAVHNPKACYTSSGFRMEDKVAVYKIPFGDTAAEFRTAVFLKEDATATQPLRVFWAWTADGNWEAPEWPRMKFGGRTALNKVYLICRSTPGEKIEDNPAYDFAREFLPVVTRLLYPPPATEAEAGPSDSTTKRAPSGPADTKSEESPPAADDKKSTSADKAPAD